MSLQLYNSLTRKKEIFKPLEEGRVLLYVCGITPNNATHLGHAFTYVSFDVLMRYLGYKGYSVNYLQNATDINDSNDVILQAKNHGRSWGEEAQYWIQHFHRQMDSLNVLRPNEYILATSIIPQIIEINKTLIEKGFAYEKNGSVYFDISKFPTYGNLSKCTRDQMYVLSKDRGNDIHDKNKKNPLDFVLWFQSHDYPNWDSPWGEGRPGWHIECSTMINSILGQQIDIHGGGEDLIYPHHESEIAQSESFTGVSPFVKTWMHTAYVLHEGEKMSKSLGNLVLVEDLLKKYSPEAVRWAILSHHYREPWEFKESEMEEAEKNVDAIRNSLVAVRDSKPSNQVTYNQLTEFEKLMDDDLNTPAVLTYIDELILEEQYADAHKILSLLGIDIN